MIELTRHFGSNDRSRRSEWLRRREWFIKSKQHNQRKEEMADKADEQFLAVASSAIVATEFEIREFERRLDLQEAKLNAYEAQLDAQDIAITKALIENGQILETISQQLAAIDVKLLAMLEGAFVLEDGRRVFKSEDGSYVIDEFGNQVSPEEVDFDLVVGPNSAEDYLAKLNEKSLLIKAQNSALSERDKLHQAQDDVDAARDRLSIARDKLDSARSALEDGDLTVQDIAELDADLEASMPTALPTLPTSAMKHLSGVEGANHIPKADSAFNSRAGAGSDTGNHSPDPAYQPTQP